LPLIEYPPPASRQPGEAIPALLIQISFKAFLSFSKCAPLAAFFVRGNSLADKPPLFAVGFK
jgi:hypothetical protein